MIGLLIVIVCILAATLLDGPPQDVVEGFADVIDPAVFLAALDPVTKAKVAKIGDDLYDGLILAKNVHSTDCNTYAQLMTKVRDAGVSQGLSPAQADNILYYVMQKDPGFFSGFFLARCMQRVLDAPTVPTTTTITSGGASTVVAQGRNATGTSIAPGGNPVTVSAARRSAPSPTVSPSQYQKVRLNIGGGNQCLTVLDGRHVLGNPVVQWPCSQTDPNQVFATDGNSNTPLRSDQNNGLCIAPGADQNGSKLVLQTCNATDPLQRWTWDRDAKSLRVKGPTGRCADINYGLRIDNSPVQIWDCNGWSFAQGVTPV
jgi:hypothetical protein